MSTLDLDGWKLMLDPRPRRRLGQTRYSKREIGLTKVFVELNGWDLVAQTLLHECAHALVGPGYAHGPVWKRKARELGVRRPGSAMRDPELRMAPSGPRGVDIVCPLHGVIGSRSRMPKRGMRYRHQACGQTVSFERKVA